jgi:hypothetical protein
MSIDMHATIDELQRAQRALVGTRERPEALQRLRQVVDRTHRVLHNLPPLAGPRDRARHAMRQVVGAVELAEGALRAHDPAACEGGRGVWTRSRADGGIAATYAS